MIRNIYLNGAMGKKFTTKVIRKDADDIFSLVHGINSEYKGFRNYTLKHPRQCVILSDKCRKNPRVVNFGFGASQFGDAEEIHIMPKHMGSGPAIVAYFGMAAAGSMTAMIMGAVINIAISMAISAIAQSLSPTQSTSATERDVQQQPSFLYNGTQNVTEQGFPVPVIYGIHMTGSVVVSAGISVEQLLVTPEQSAPPANGGGGTQPSSPPAMSWQWGGGV